MLGLMHFEVSKHALNRVRRRCVAPQYPGDHLTRPVSRSGFEFGLEVWVRVRSGFEFGFRLRGLSSG